MTGLLFTNVMAVNYDDESVSILVDLVAGLQVSKDGIQTATFEISATVFPGGNEDITVPLSITPAIATLSVASAILAVGGNHTVQVTVTGVDDVSDVRGTLLDDDTPQDDGTAVPIAAAIPTLSDLGILLMALVMLVTL